MKKLLILMMVLAMASIASAVLQISVNGNPTPADSEIIVGISETLEIGIYSTGNEPDSFWALIAPIGLGSITGGAVHIPPAPDASMLLGTLEEQYLSEFYPGWEGVVGTVGSFGSQPPYAGGDYFDGFTFHCEGAGDILIKLVEIDGLFWWPTGTVFDSVVIHCGVIPEPATLLLLGLGGLTLLRNRKK